MRLIDADAYLDKVCTYKTTGCGSCKFQTVCPADEPTVEAIPIEWIRNYVSHWVSEIYKNFVLNMITKWEKENEQERVNPKL